MLQGGGASPGLACDGYVDFDVALVVPRFSSRASLAALETGVFDDEYWPCWLAMPLSNSRNAASAANSIRGSRVIRIGRQMARSNIQAGNSSQRSVAPSREQRRTMLSTFAIVSWIRTRHLAQGCQG